MEFVVPAIAYQTAFALAALGCALALQRAMCVTDGDTRRSLVGMLATSAIWSGSHAALFALPDAQFAVPVYLVGLVAGFATIFLWLAFASAYTGRTYHRNPTLRRAAVGTYLAVVAVKVTNPFHELYFRATFVQEPFPHVAFQQEVFHWTVTGLSYALAAIGLFMLFELYGSADYDTRGLVGLVGLTVIPVGFDLLGYSTTALVDVIYAPLGVAAFAIGVLYVYEDRFLAVQLTNDVDEPVVFLDDDDHVRDYNAEAAALFPALDDAIGDHVDNVSSLARALEDVDDVHEHVVDGETRYLLVSRESFDLGRVTIGQLVLVTDVTAVERERAEVRRHDDQLEDFAVGIRHELRNDLTVVRGHLENAAAALEDGEVGTANDSLATASTAARGMTDTVDGLATLAQYGQSVADTAPVSLGAVARDARSRTDLSALDVDVAGDASVVADGTRLEALLRSAYRFAAANGATTVRVAPTDDGFVLEDDGDPIAPEDVERVFDHGDAVPTAEAGMALPNVRSLGRVQGWRVDVDPEYDDGVRVVVANASVHDSTADSVAEATDAADD
ncbi:histidine kinase N-terminal 7TM domain-containing protein [Halorubellus salinus]|uniref:histidine kinase N-terminal 7TM domain-containing protein n=1 Tax=Halorubellus salinus TaxID=755309 RepID=UPI001D0602E7|nr:histidine kinase N-terminal 7TM domain-containing protein [Halorubellus salinus]